MRQEMEIQSEIKNEINRQPKKERIDKKRMIRKNKMHVIPQYVDLRSIDTSKLSREDRAKVQKVKNREAAQRSRDMHRQYVLNLEKQVKQLRQKVSRKICWRCRKEVDDESSSSDQHTNERTIQENNPVSFQKEEEYNSIQFSQNEALSKFDLEESLLRVQQNDDGDYSSYMKLMMFVCMIAIAVLWIGGTKQEAVKNSRALMELSTIIENAKIDQQQKDNLISKGSTAIVPAQKRLIAFNSDDITTDCLLSLMTTNFQHSDPKKSLRSYHQTQEQIISSNYITNKEEILLCSVHTPKTYHQKYGKLQSPLVKLYMLGSEIKQMLGQFNLLIPLREGNIQINGIYRVAVEIKGVDLVSDHNCLL